ncbi:MAG: hypothetical protein D6791_00850 [Chloroflexi bacterium]|nr:MAG: hypothetical protein D6791_00850 [Chloroflexota bacterium]
MSIIQRIRRNHATEHATIHVLSAWIPNLTIAGRADNKGFFLYGDVPTEAVRAAAEDALRRLQAGEAHLAVHPRCGTNLVIAGLLAGVSSLVATAGRPRSLLDRLPRMLLATTAAVLAAQPLGPIIQEKITTSPELAGVRVADIRRQQLGKMTVHRVLLEDT